MHPICFNVAASASLRAESVNCRLSPPLQLVIPSAKDKDKKKPLLWLWPHASAHAEPSPNHSPHFNRVKIKELSPRQKPYSTEECISKHITRISPTIRSVRTQILLMHRTYYKTE